MTASPTDRLRADLAALYPQYGLRVAHAGTVLVGPTDEELFELAAVVAEPGGVVAPDREAELPGWPSGSGDAGDTAARRFLEWAWRLREAPTPARWRAPLAVVDGGRAVGLAVLSRADAGAVRTSTWLARAEQGRGLGRRVRLMLLELAFAHLGATRAVSDVAEGSTAVTPGAWRPRRLSDVDVDGVDAFREAVT